MIAGLRLACAKRPVTSVSIERMVDEIEAELQQRSGNEVTSENLGTIIMGRLPELDPVAYIRFASVYRNFQEIESFEKAVKDLRVGTQQLPLLDNTPPPPQPRRRGRPRAAVASSSAPPAEPDGADPAIGNESDESDESETLSEAVGTMGSDQE